MTEECGGLQPAESSQSALGELEPLSSVPESHCVRGGFRGYICQQNTRMLILIFSKFVRRLLKHGNLKISKNAKVSKKSHFYIL